MIFLIYCLHLSNFMYQSSILFVSFKWLLRIVTALLIFQLRKGSFKSFGALSGQWGSCRLSSQTSTSCSPNRRCAFSFLTLSLWCCLFRLEPACCLSYRNGILTRKKLTWPKFGKELILCRVFFSVAPSEVHVVEPVRSCIGRGFHFCLVIWNIIALTNKQLRIINVGFPHIFLKP